MGFPTGSWWPWVSPAAGILKLMSIFLAGAGPDYDAFPYVFQRFVQAVTAHQNKERLHTERPARIAVVVHHRSGNPEEVLAAYVRRLQTLISCELVPVLLSADNPADPAVFNGVDGIVVGGGLTPAYLEGLRRVQGPSLPG
jgi:cyanophycinase